ncbi:MAG: multiubiquitin domain-containing protein [Rectinemataceae bacterium]
MSNNDHEKTVTIIVDATQHQWPKEEISYAEVVTLAFPDYPNHPEISYSVKYKRGQGHKPEGTLSPGGSVKVKEGMVFNVSQTGQS